MTTATLRPQPAESVAWDHSQNIIIEGDNLVALKVLQRSYHGTIKMIYIDPPYSAGAESNHSDWLGSAAPETLNSSSGTHGDTMSINHSEASKGVHSSWLSMMYPRLLLARNLLRADGLIFCSIDDHEVHNLRLLLDEVFGEDGFIAQLIWKKRPQPSLHSSAGVSPDHEYVLVYGREEAKLRGLQKAGSKYSNPDHDPRGPWTSHSLLRQGTYASRPRLAYTIIDPDTGRAFKPIPGTFKKNTATEKEHQIELICVVFPRSPEG